MRAGIDGTDAGARSAHGAGTAGLVPSKTSQGARQDGGFVVSLGASAIAEKRVARLKRAVWASGHLHKLSDKGHRPPVCWFVTLTYRGVDDWQAQHISRAVELFRQWCRRIKAPCRYTWVAELQGRGAVHYHLLAWLPVGVHMPQWDRKLSASRVFWPHGMSNTQKARSGVGYLMKYLSKLGEFHRFPKGLRLYGIGGLDESGKAVRQWFNLPEWAKAIGGVGAIKRTKAGLVVQDSGEILCSPWRVLIVPGALVVRLVGSVVPRWFSGAYSEVRFA